MLFYEPQFLFAFFPVAFAVFLLVRSVSRAAVGWIALASCGFYFWAEPKFFWLALASSLLDYTLAKRIAAGSKGPWLAIGIVTNIGLLVVFKYTGFLVGEVANPTLAWLSATQLTVPQLALPVGISFIVFEKITYLVDVHRRVSPPAASLVKYLFYVFFFPKLLAGPIIKYHEIEPQIQDKPALSMGLVALGMERFAIGVVKKLLLADSAAVIVDQIYSAPAAQVGQIDAWVGSFFFAAQIYFDFSGYSDMALGLAMMLGFRLRENFNFPYVSVGITEFWRRWHISLSTWIKEYLYIPMGGSRGSTLRTYFNLFVAFMASGLWHGADWTFVVWGAYHGAFLVAERAFLGKVLKAVPIWIGIAFTFLAVLHGWVLFRATSFDQAVSMFAKMYGGDVIQWTYVPISTLVVVFGAMIASMTARLWMPYVGPSCDRPSVRLGLRIVLVALFLIALGKVLAMPFQPFLYFRF